MGKVILLVIAVSVGYMFGFRDARAHERDVVSRVVDHVRTSLGRPGSNVDSIMTQIEGKK
jgi:hypothetical protein